MIVVIGASSPETVFRYTVLLNQLGFSTLGVRETTPLLSCIQDPRSVLLLLEDGFVPNTSAHTLINLVRSTPGPKSSIPVIRVWKGPVLVTGTGHNDCETIKAPVTGKALESAMHRLGLIRGG